MRASATLVALLLGTLAGCSDAPGDAAPAPDGEAHRPVTLHLNGTTGSGAGSHAIDLRVLLSGELLAFSVLPGATLIHAELAWDDPVYDLDLRLRSPDAGNNTGLGGYDHGNDNGTLGQPDSPHSVTVRGDYTEAGDWHARPFPEGATAGTPFRLAVTVFYGETQVPDGFSALDPPPLSHVPQPSNSALDWAASSAPGGPAPRPRDAGIV